MQRIMASGLISAVLAATMPALAQEDYATWSSYKNVIINTKTSGAGVGASVVNYPVLVRLDSTAADVFTQAGTGGASLRFAKPSGAKRPYHIESWDATAKTAAIWVLADTVKGNDSTVALRMYWGKGGAADSSKSTAVFDTANGYRAVFHLNEASGNVTSSTFAPVTGTDSGGTAAAAGVIGSARNFVNPSNSNTGAQFINLGKAEQLNFGGPTTMESWVRWLSSASFRTVLFRVGPGSEELQLRINAGGNNPVYLAGRWTGSNDVAAQSPQVAGAYGDSAQWVHLAAVYDSTATNSRVWRLYRNGVEIAVSTHNNAAGSKLQSPAGQWWLGKSGPDIRYWHGQLDETRISNVTRSPDYMKLNYETQKPGATAIKLGATQGGTVAPSNLVYSPDSLVVGVGVAVNLAPTYVGAVDSFTVAPALPDSLKLNKITGAITGNARTVKALTSYVITATNGFGTAKDTIRLAVVAVPPTNLVYPSQSLSLTAGAPFAPNVPTVSGAVDSFTVAPALPAGLTLNKTTGAISGKPSAASAAANYTITATNSSGNAKDTVNITVTAAVADGAYSGWAQHKYVSIDTRQLGAPQLLLRYPLLVRLDSTNFNFSQTSFGGPDIRFTKVGDAVRLPHQVDSWDAAAKRAAIWVLVDSVRGNNVTNFRMHWGKAGVADSSNGAAVFGAANGFGAVWHMNDAAGNITDATANGATGTNNGTTPVAGHIGGARNFAGANAANNTGTGVQNITVGDPEGLDLGEGRVTLEAWVRWERIRPTTGNTFWRNILMRQSGNDELHLRIDGNTPYNYRVGAYIGNTDYGPTSEQAASAYGDSAKWVHLVGVYDSVGPASNAWKLYRNGALVGQGGEGDPNVTGRGNWFIGSWSGSNNRRYFVGDMDELRISKTHRTASWVKVSYETQKTGQTVVAFADTLKPGTVVSLGDLASMAEPLSLSARASGKGFLFQVRGVETGSTVRLSVIDMSGREVWSRVETEGRRAIQWDGAARNGSLVGNGMYAIRLSVQNAEGRTVATRRLMLPLMQ